MSTYGKKDLKKEGRGAYDHRLDQNTGTHLVKWFDNECVLVGSNFAVVEATTTLERFYVTQKKVQVQCPDMVAQYNASTDSVDLADMLIELYRTKITTKKLWHLELTCHCVDIAWLIYCRHCGHLHVHSKKCLSLRRFLAQIAESLRLKDEDPERSTGRPKKSISPTHIIGRKPVIQTPIPDIRYGGVAHWPEID